MKQKSIFLNGKMIKARNELIESLAPGAVRRFGAFETMRVYRGRIFALEEHFNRLFRGLRLLEIRSPYSRKQWEQHLYRTIKCNGLREARIRLAVWRENRRIRIAIVCQSNQKHQDDKLKRGFKASISSIKRMKTRFSNVKSMDYGCFRNAFQQAEREGFDEAILLNSRSEIVEGSRTNIFFAKRGVLYTPSVKAGCLNGITRQITIENARRLGISCRAVCVYIKKLLQADEAFVTNSLIGIMPLTSVDGRLINQSVVGPITNKLLRAYKKSIHSCPA